MVSDAQMAMFQLIFNLGNHRATGQDFELAVADWLATVISLRAQLRSVFIELPTDNKETVPPAGWMLPVHFLTQVMLGRRHLFAMETAVVHLHGARSEVESSEAEVQLIIAALEPHLKSVLEGERNVVIVNAPGTAYADVIALIWQPPPERPSCVLVRCKRYTDGDSAMSAVDVSFELYKMGNRHDSLDHLTADSISETVDRWKIAWAERTAGSAQLPSFLRSTLKSWIDVHGATFDETTKEELLDFAEVTPPDATAPDWDVLVAMLMKLKVHVTHPASAQIEKQGFAVSYVIVAFGAAPRPADAPNNTYLVYARPWDRKKPRSVWDDLFPFTLDVGVGTGQVVSTLLSRGDI